MLGTQKGGTTSLYNYLLQHPSVFGATGKETGYLLQEDIDEAEYRAYFPLQLIKKVWKKALSKDFRTGEASTAYLFNDDVPDRAKHLLDDIQLIALLRDPTERAFSAHKHWQRLGNEQRSFEEAIKEELEKHKKGEQTEFEYLRRGLYEQQLRRWFQRFPRETFFIRTSESMFEDPQMVYDELLAFLDLAEHKISSFPVVNKGSDKQMSNDIRKRLEAFYDEPEQRLYDLMGWSEVWND